MLGVDDEQYGQRLVAFVVLTPVTSATVDDLKQHVRDNLATTRCPARSSCSTSRRAAAPARSPDATCTVTLDPAAPKFFVSGACFSARLDSDKGRSRVARDGHIGAPSAPATAVTDETSTGQA